MEAVSALGAGGMARELGGRKPETGRRGGEDWVVAVLSVLTIGWNTEHGTWNKEEGRKA